MRLPKALSKTGETASGSSSQKFVGASPSKTPKNIFMKALEKVSPKKKISDAEQVCLVEATCESDSD